MEHVAQEEWRADGASNGGTRLTGPVLRLAQAAWLIVTLTVIAIQVVGLPALYKQLGMVCTAPTAVCEEVGQPTAAQAAVFATAGLTLDSYAVLITGIEALMVAIWIGVGVVIFIVRADDWLALLVALMLIVFSSATFISGSLSAAAATYPLLSLPVAALAILGEVLIVAFFLLFPNGRLFPRWLWWLIPMRAFAALLDYVPAFRSLPSADTISTFLLLPVIVIMLAVQAYRYRRISTSRERSQTRWVLYGVVVGLGTFILLLIVTGVTGFWESPWAVLVWTAVNVVATLIPITFGIAILRSNLWDIDVVIRRTTVYAVLTALLALVYFGSIVVLQQFLTPLTGDSAPAVVLSTLLIAALFLPLRRRVQDVIDRRFFRRKYDAEKVLARFAATVRDETDLDALTAELVRVIQETMQPEEVSVWLVPIEPATASAADTACSGSAGALKVVSRLRASMLSIRSRNWVLSGSSVLSSLPRFQIAAPFTCG
jgi:hypothetical protein